MNRSNYEPGQVCLNGHMVNSATQSHPEDSAPFCDECGAKTITACPSCNLAIPGKRIRHEVGEWIVANPSAPAYCSGCGNAYPWTAAAIEAAVELLADAAGDASTLGADIQNLTSENPRTPVAVVRIKAALSKATKPVADATKTILAGIVTEAVKRQLWP